MKKLILHIGSHKTGTSSLQFVLHVNKELLQCNDCQLTRLGYLMNQVGFENRYRGNIADQFNTKDKPLSSKLETQEIRYVQRIKSLTKQFYQKQNDYIGLLKVHKKNENYNHELHNSNAWKLTELLRRLKKVV